MEEEGIVSVWVGEADSAQDFERATGVSFSEDGDFLGSKFSQALELGYYDAGLMEAEYRETPRENLRALLQGVSYADQILPQLETNQLGTAANCFVLLYDHRFFGAATFQEKGVRLTFLGLATYNAAPRPRG